MKSILIAFITAGTLALVACGGGGTEDTGCVINTTMRPASDCNSDGSPKSGIPAQCVGNVSCE